MKLRYHFMFLNTLYVSLTLNKVLRRVTRLEESLLSTNEAALFCTKASTRFCRNKMKQLVCVCVCLCVCVCVCVHVCVCARHQDGGAGPRGGWKRQHTRHSATRWPRFSAGERRLRCEEYPQTRRDRSPSAAAATFVARPAREHRSPAHPVTGSSPSAPSHHHTPWAP